jgi:hypothetical protein
MEPRNRFQGMNSASLCSLAERYDNPIPPRFLAPIDCLKIPARGKEKCWNFRTIYGGWNRVEIELSCWPSRLHRLAESIPELLKSLNIPSLLDQHTRTGGREERRACELLWEEVVKRNFFTPELDLLSFKEPGNRFQGSNSARLCNVAWRVGT